MRGRLDVTLTTEARERFQSFLARPRDFTPTLVFLKGREPSESADYWTFNAYGPDNISGLTPGLWLTGRPLLYDCDGFTVAIPQPKFLPELQGKVLSVGDTNRLVVVGDKHDG
jgi:hypothetical protein